MAGARGEWTAAKLWAASFCIALLAGGPTGRVAAQEAIPPADPQIAEYADAARTLVVHLSAGWQSNREPTDPDEMVASFRGPADAEPRLTVSLWVEPRHARAGLLVSDLLRTYARDPEDARSGAGWYQAGGTDEKAALHGWVRALEKGGRVYAVWVSVRKEDAAAARPEAFRILDSLAVPAEERPPPPPEKFTVLRLAGFDVWYGQLNIAYNRQRLDSALPVLRDARDLVGRMLRGAPFDASRPLVRFASDAKTAFLPDQRLVAVESLVQEPVAGQSALDLWLAGAQQAVWQHFGGTPPRWIAWGLSRYAAFSAEAGGKLGEPALPRILEIRNSVARDHHRLEEWIAPDCAIAPSNDTANDALAWHMFFRNGPAKKYAKAYDASLAALRATGDVEEFRKAWNAADITRIEKEFTDRLAKLK